MADDIRKTGGPFNEELRLRIRGICHVCIHRTGLVTCRAFPDGIPRSILIGEVIHTERFPTQLNDIVFEKNDRTLSE